VWLLGAGLITAAALTSPRAARAVPAFAQQTGQPCKACHVGGFGPELTPFGREFKLGGYTLRAHASIPIAAMAVASYTHTRKGQDPAPEHLSKNDNVTLDEAAMFIAGGLGQHLGAFAEITYEGIDKHFTWDNLDVRAVTPGHLFGQEATFGLSLNNSPTVQDPWNTLPAWGFPFTDTETSETPAAAPLIDDSLAQGVVGLTGYTWVAHKLYLEAGGYTSPSRGTLSALGSDPFDPGKVHGVAPYGRAALQTEVGGGTFEIGASALKAAMIPQRDGSSGFTDHYTDVGFDSSWQKTLNSSDIVSLNFRFEHEKADLRASCALGLIGDDSDADCGHYHLTEIRAAARYTLHDKIGLTLSPFSITGSRNPNVFDGNGSPDSNGVMGQVDYTFWPSSNSPLGPRVNARVGAQYTIYGKFNGRHRDFDGEGTNAADNNVLRVFSWIAF
jgi:hypothetical protein